MADLILKLGLENGRNADALVAAENLAAWVHYVREAARAIDPAVNRAGFAGGSNS